MRDDDIGIPMKHKRRNRKRLVRQPAKQQLFGKQRKSSHFRQQVQKYEKKIFAIFLTLCGLIGMLAVLSYTPYDVSLSTWELRDFWRLLIGDPQLRAVAETTQNWLGIVGALIADFLINYLLGYWVLSIPVLLLLWAYWIWKECIPQKLPFYSGIVLGYALLCATFVGILSYALDLVALQWSGAVGEFFAYVFRSLFGTVGAIILVVGFGLFLSIIGFGDHLLQKLLATVKTYWSALILWLRGKIASPALRKERIEEKNGVQEQPVIVSVSREPEYAEPEPAQIVRARLEGENKRREIGLLERADEEKRGQHHSENMMQRQQDGTGSEESSVQKSEKLNLTVEEKVEEKVVPDKTFVKVHPLDEHIEYHPPTVDLLIPPDPDSVVDEEELKRNAEILQQKLRTFRVEIENITVTPGPVVTQYEFVPAEGIKVSQIESLADDIALALKARGIRIIAPVPGRGTVAVEIPNHRPGLVRFSEIIRSAKFQSSQYQLPIALGKTTVGEVYVADLAQMPHLLIAGATGSGKSVGINVIIASLLYKMHPRYLKFLIIDPKKVEMTPYRKLANHFLAVCPDIDETILTTPEHAVAGLRSVELEMERRYDLLAKAGQRNIQDYNRKIRERKIRSTEEVEHRELPYIVVVIDELADLMMTASKEVEEPITRLAQLARAVGIHLVVATQRPSVDVITGLIKANFPARIAYQVASKVDSRTILDMNGAEQLIGKGDLLMMTGTSPKPVRLQNAFLTVDEVEAICDFIAQQPGYSQPYQLPSLIEKSKADVLERSGERDELFDIAARIVVQYQQGSVSLLQRRLKIGYARAARIMDQLEEAGIVGPFEGSKARAVYVQSEEELEEYLR